jgi:hypothetical protein
MASSEEGPSITKNDRFADDLPPCTLAISMNRFGHICSFSRSPAGLK